MWGVARPRDINDERESYEGSIAVRGTRSCCLLNTLRSWCPFTGVEKAMPERLGARSSERRAINRLVLCVTYALRCSCARLATSCVPPRLMDASLCSPSLSEFGRWKHEIKGLAYESIMLEQPHQQCLADHSSRGPRKGQNENTWRTLRGLRLKILFFTNCYSTRG